MSDEKTNGTNGAEVAEAALAIDWQSQVASGISMVTGFLKAIVVNDKYTIRDFLKNDYEFEAALRARTAIKASLMIDGLLAGKGDTETVMQAQAVMVVDGKMAALRFVLKRVIEDDRSEKAVQELYELIHPEIIAAAQAAEVKHCKGKEVKRKPYTHVLDLFEADMLAEALVPFFAQLATKIGGMLTRALDVKPAVPASTESSPASP